MNCGIEENAETLVSKLEPVLLAVDLAIHDMCTVITRGKVLGDEPSAAKDQEPLLDHDGANNDWDVEQVRSELTCNKKKLLRKMQKLKCSQNRHAHVQQNCFIKT
mmetsp:Transcript_58559/g.68389  ORF Transcript_58559/g.68389 Transcript_58559/m.68389 type:complete len:105 (+) Transcript_58559:15-329(+)